MNYNSIKNEVSNVLHEMKGKSNDEIERMFGIEFNDDGTIFDPTYQREFESIAEWAWFSAEQDEIEMSENINSKGRLEDFY